MFCWLQRRDLGCPESVEAVNATAALHGGGKAGKINGIAAVAASNGPLAEFGGKMVQKLVARPADGLVREINEKQVISHEEIKDRLETEDIRHLGDFTDEVSNCMIVIDIWYF